MFRRKFLMAAIVAAIAIAATPLTGVAAFTATGTIGGNSATVSDGNGANVAIGSASFGAGDIAPLAGTITTTAVSPGVVAAGQFDVNGFRIGVNSVSSESPTQANMSTTSFLTVYNSSLVTQTLTLSITNTFTLPGAAGSLLVLNHRLTAIAWFNGTDIAGASNPPSVISSEGIISDSGGTVTTLPLSVSGGVPVGLSNYALFLRSDGTYDLTQQFEITLGAGQSVQFQGSVNAVVPAPAGLILAATALPFVGLLRRRLRKPEATIAA
jgi:hypothetical protein